MNVKIEAISPDGRIYIPTSARKLGIKCGKGYIAPLHCKRKLLVSIAQRWEAWTLIHENMSTEGWWLPRAKFPKFYYDIEFKDKQGGFLVQLPNELFTMKFLLREGEILKEIATEGADEVNIWRPETHRIQMWLETEEPIEDDDEE